MPCPTRVYKHFTSLEGWPVASGQCNGAVSPLPCQSVDGFFYFHDLIRIIMNGLIDANIGSSL